MSAKTLLYVDDDEVLRERLSRAFIARGLRVLAAASVEEACEHLESVSPDLALVDLKIPDSGPPSITAHTVRCRWCVAA